MVGLVVADCCCMNWSILACVGLARGGASWESSELKLALRSGLLEGRSSGLKAGLPRPRFSTGYGCISFLNIISAWCLTLSPGSFSSSSSSLSLSNAPSVSRRGRTAGAELPEEPIALSRLVKLDIQLLRDLAALEEGMAEAGSTEPCQSCEP